MPLTNDTILTVAEAAAHLRISKPAMYDLVHRADFPKIFVGRKILIPRIEFFDWIHREAGGAHAAN